MLCVIITCLAIAIVISKLLINYIIVVLMLFAVGTLFCKIFSPSSYNWRMLIIRVSENFGLDLSAQSVINSSWSWGHVSGGQLPTI